MKLAFIGLGLMGRPMAGHLLKAGHEVTVWSRRAESLQPVLAQGARAAGSGAEAVREAEVVFSMVADAPDVEQVALGPQGVAEGVGSRAGVVFVDMSTIAPSAAQRIAAKLAERGIAMLDAPVSGGESGAIAASLTIMVGGDEAVFERVRPLFEAMGKTVSYIGASGAGQVTKACNQILTGVGVAADAEALNFARRSGVDANRVRAAMLGGSAGSRILENHGQRMLDRNFKPGFKAWMHQKDMRIVLDEAHRMGLAVPTAAATAQLFNALVGSGQGEDDSIAVLQLLERMSGDGG